MVPRLFTEIEVSKMFGIPISALKNMRYRPAKDPIPFTKVGGSVRYREDLLRKWLDRNTFDDSLDAKEYRKLG